MNYELIYRAAPEMYKALRKVPIIKMDGGTGLGYECLGCHELNDNPCKPDCWVMAVEKAVALAEGYEIVEGEPNP